MGQQRNGLVAFSVQQAGFFHIEVTLQSKPQICRSAQGSRQAQCSIRRDAAPPFDDVSDPAMRHGAGDGETILADAERPQEIFQEHFAGVDIFQAFYGVLMVIDNVNRPRVMARRPVRADMPLVIHSNAPLAFSASFLRL